MTPPIGESRSSRSGIKWLVAISGVLFAAFALVYGLAHQPIYKITPTEIIFGQPSVPTDQVEQSQSRVRASVSNLDNQIDNGRIPAGVSDFTGTWLGGDGLTYQIRQSGADAWITIPTPYGIAMWGTGTVEGARFTFNYTTANQQRGHGWLTLDSAHQLSGEFQSGAESVDAVMTR